MNFVNILTAIAMLLTAAVGIAAAPAPTFDANTATREAMTGVSGSVSVCMALTSASATDVDSLMTAAMTADQRNSARVADVTLISGDSACFAFDSTVTCNPIDTGSAKGYIATAGSSRRYLLRRSFDSTIPQLAARSTGSSVLCVELVY